MINTKLNNLVGFPALTVAIAAPALFSAAAVRAASVYHATVPQGTCEGSVGCEFSASALSTCTPTLADAYLTGEQSRPSLQNTPEYIHRLMHPGLFYSKSGKAGYEIKEKSFLSPDDFNDSYNALTTYIRTTPEVKAQVATLCPNDNPDDKGCGFQVGDQKIILQVSPLKTENHRAAVSFLRSWIGKIETLSEEEIVAKILDANRILFKGMNAGMSTDGTLRKADICVYRDNEEDRDRSPQAIAKLIRKRGGTSNDIAIYKKYVEKMRGITTWPKMSPEESRVMSFVCFPPCHFRDVPEKMKEFARNLKESVIKMKGCGRIDPIALGAFAHLQIGKIHPFGDGNGRLARAVMNALLMEFGQMPIVFGSDEEYTAAIERDAKEPGYFAKYLTKIAIPDMQKAGKYLPEYPA